MGSYSRRIHKIMVQYHDKMVILCALAHNMRFKRANKGGKYIGKKRFIANSKRR